MTAQNLSPFQAQPSIPLVLALRETWRDLCEQDKRGA